MSVTVDVDGSSLIGVEEVEGCFDLDDFFLGDSSLGVPFGIEGASFGGGWSFGLGSGFAHVCKIF